MQNPEEQFQQGRARNFSTTHWTVVLLAGDSKSGGAANALENLCRTYWYPLYAYVRSRGRSAHDAQDLTQEFFRRILEKKYLKLADPEKGKFRTFLLTSMDNFLFNDWEKSQAIKRGGGQENISIDSDKLENRYILEASNGNSPDKIYDKSWALALLENVLNQLSGEYAQTGKQGLFEALKGRALGDAGSDEDYCALSERLKVSQGSLRVGAHRMRERYRELLFTEVSHTVSSVEDVDGELRHLIATLRA
jgi:RNA polymerase sigma-70 factor (ECF subfamily)